VKEAKDLKTRYTKKVNKVQPSVFAKVTVENKDILNEYHNFDKILLPDDIDF
jgi:hypothetical protein